MNYSMYRDGISIIGVFTLIIYLTRFKKLKNNMDFPLYIYFVSFPFDINRIIPYFDEALKIILIIGFLILVLKNKKLRINRYEFYYFIIVLITSIINIYVNNYNVMNTYLINLLFMLFFSFYAYNTILSIDHLKEISRVFVLNAIILSTLSFIEYNFVGVPRPQVSLGNPNYFGLYIMISLLFAYYLIPRISFKSIVISIVLGYGIIVSGSNSLLLVLLILGAFYLVVKSRIKIIQKMFWVGIIVTTIIYMSITIISFDNSGFISLFVKDDLLRIYLWKASWDIFRNNFFHGIGYGALLIPFEKYYFVTHNDYLRIMGEIGILGLLIFIKYISNQYKIILSFDMKTKMFLGGSFLSILFFSLTHNNMNSILFWWILALPQYFNVFIKNPVKVESSFKNMLD